MKELEKDVERLRDLFKQEKVPSEVQEAVLKVVTTLFREYCDLAVSYSKLAKESFEEDKNDEWSQNNVG